MLSFVTLRRATEGFFVNGVAGFVGLPGFMYSMLASHLMFEVCVCP